jgi:hypothetical protein
VPTDETKKVLEEMNRTTFATQAAPAAGTRPCDGLGHDYRWREVSCVMNISFMNVSTIKRPARRLGKLPT